MKPCTFISVRPWKMLFAGPVACTNFSGAGIGFPQRSCKAKARYVAKVLPSGQLGKQGGNNPGADTNQPEDQEDAATKG